MWDWRTRLLIEVLHADNVWLGHSTSYVVQYGIPEVYFEAKIDLQPSRSQFITIQTCDFICTEYLNVALQSYEILLDMQSEALDPKLTVIDTMVEAAPDAKINDIKALLGRMMFSGKSMEKKVEIHLGLLIINQILSSCVPYLVWAASGICAKQSMDHETLQALSQCSQRQTKHQYRALPSSFLLWEFQKAWSKVFCMQHYKLHWIGRCLISTLHIRWVFWAVARKPGWLWPSSWCHQPPSWSWMSLPIIWISLLKKCSRRLSSNLRGLLLQLVTTDISCDK